MLCETSGGKRMDLQFYLKKQHNIEKNKTCEYNKSKKVRKSYCLKWRY